MAKDNLRTLHTNLTEKWEGFSVPFEQFSEDMKNEDNLQRLHKNLTEKWEGFSVPYGQFKSDMGLDKILIGGFDVTDFDEGEKETFSKAMSLYKAEASERTDQRGAVYHLTPLESISEFKKRVQELKDRTKDQNLDDYSKEKLIQHIDKLREQYGLQFTDDGNIRIDPAYQAGFKQQFDRHYKQALKERAEEEQPNFLTRAFNTLAAGTESALARSSDLFGTLIGIQYFDSSWNDKIKYKKEQAQKLAAKYDIDDKTIEETLKTGDIGDVLVKGTLKSLESLPEMLPLLLSRDPRTVWYLSGTSGLDKYRELEDKDMPTWERIYNASITGIAEGLFEGAVTVPIINRTRAAVMNYGVESTKRTLKNTTENALLRNINRVRDGMPDFIKEAASEMATQMTENVVDKATFNPDKDLTEGIIDAGVIGGITGKLLSAPRDFINTRDKAVQYAKAAFGKIPSSMTIEEKILVGDIVAEKESLLDLKKKVDSSFHPEIDKVVENLDIEIRRKLGLEIEPVEGGLETEKVVSDLQQKTDFLKDKGEAVEDMTVSQIEAKYEELKPKEDVTQKTKQTEVSKEEPITEPEIKPEPITETVDTGKSERKEKGDETEVVIPAETLSQANESFKAAQENLSDADAAQESFKTVERSEWYQGLPKEQQAEAKAKFLNEIAERFPPKPVKRRKSKVQEVIDRFVKPSMGKPKKVTVQEYAALKTQIRLEARAAREGAKAKETDIKTQQSALMEYVKSELYDVQGVDIGKVEIERMMNSIKRARNINSLEKQIDRVDSVVEKVKTKAVKRVKSNIFDFVKKSRTTQVSGKKKAKGGNEFTIPYFKKAAKMIQGIEGSISIAKSTAMLSYPTGDLKGKAAKENIEKRKAEQSQIQEELITSIINKARDEAKDKLLYGPESTRVEAEAELAAVEDYASYNNLTFEDVDNFFGYMKKIDQQGKAALKEDIAAEASRLRNIVEEVESVLGIKDEELTQESKANVNLKEAQRSRWQKIKDLIGSPKEFGQSILKFDFHLKTLLEFMSIEDVEVGKGKLIKNVYNKIVEADGIEMGGIQEAASNIKDLISESTNAETEKDFIALDQRMIERVNVNQIIDGENVPINLSVGEVMTMYAWSKTPELMSELETKHGITETELQRLKGEIGSDLIDVVDKTVNYLSTEYAETINPVYKEIFRINFPIKDNYFPVKRIFTPTTEVKESESTFSRITASMASGLKERTQTARGLRYVSEPGRDVSFINIVNEHIAEMEHFKAFARVAKDIDAIVNSPKFKQRANNVLGRGGYKRVTDLIKHSINNDIYHKDKTSLSRLLGAHGIATLGANVKQLPIQLSSMVSGMVEYQSGKGDTFGLDTIMWMKEVAKLMNPANFAETGQLYAEILENSPKLKARWAKNTPLDPDLLKRVKDARVLSKKQSIFEKIGRGAMEPVRMGDVGAIFLGYAPIYVSAKAKYMSEGLSEPEAIKKAIKEFEVYEESQQSRSSVHLSHSQLKDSIGNKVLTMYKSSPKLFVNQTIQAVNSIRRSYKEGGIKNIKKKDVKRLLVYHSLVSMTYQLMASGITALLRGDDEDFWSDMLRAGALGSLNGLFILGDIGTFVADRLQGKEFDLSFGVDILKPISDILKEITKDDPDFMNSLQEMTFFMASIFQVPAKNLIDNTGSLIDFIETGDIDKFMMSLGYSEYQVTGKTKQERNKKKSSYRSTKRRRI